ncbi:MAG: O-antigen translocase [Hyphomicrobium sp.]|uniref:O-antigen translocase n=1 Tax=Hyphomicrobium sp. TaxID=82 RepID=UPI003D0F3716
MQKSYGQILKSSALIGGSSILVVAIGIIRTKVMAVLLGTAGFGLFGLFSSIVDVVVAIAGMGINASGVRQIAEAVSTEDERRIARTVTVLRRVALVLGVAGGVLLAIMSPQVSVLTFGSDRYAWAIALLSLAVFFRLVTGGQGALIQGTRRIADLARVSIFGALASVVISIPVIYVLREEGVAPALVCIAAASLAISWWYSRKIEVDTPSMTVSDVRSEASALLKLGLAFMASAFLMMAASYAVRMMLVRQIDLEAAGLYGAAWTLGGLYVNFVLQAMGADFYPRLVGVSSNDPVCNRLTNEQAQVSMLLAGPGVCATIVFAPLVISLFYSSEFFGAVDTLRWICMGVALRVITWPIGYIIVAKGRQEIFFLTELLWAIVNVSLTWYCIGRFGVDGAGIAFFGSYVFHGLMIYPIVRVLSGFRWTWPSLQIGAIFILCASAVFLSCRLLPPPWDEVAGIAITVATALYSLHRLLQSLAEDRLPARVQKLLGHLRIARWYTA